MIPKEYIATGEIPVSNNVYIIALESIPQSAESNTISVKITDAETFLIGKIENEEILALSEKLRLSAEKLAECFRKAIRERKPVFDETEKTVKLFLVNGTKTAQITIQLNMVNETERKAVVKNLLLQMARHIRTVEELMTNANNLQGFESGFGNHILGSQAYTKKIPKAKRTNPGMSIVNPTSKRSKSKPGVQFNKGSSDESD